MAGRVKRAISAGLTGAGDVFGTMLQGEVLKKRQADAAYQERVTEALKLLMEGKITPEQAGGFVNNVGIEPPSDVKLGDLYKTMGDATTMQGVPTEESASQSFRAKRVPLNRSSVENPFGDMQARRTTSDSQEGDNLPSTSYGPGVSVERRRFSEARQAKLRSFEPKELGAGMTGTGMDARPTKDFFRLNPDTGLNELVQSIASGPTAGQSGDYKLRETLANELSPERTQADITQKNEVERGTRDEKVTTSARVAGADTTARINAQHANMSKLADVAYRETLARGQANLSMLGDEVRIREFAQTSQRVKKASVDALGAVSQVRALLPAAEAEIRNNKAIRAAALGGSVVLDRIPRIWMGPDAKAYLDAVDTLRAQSARLGGDVGNLAGTEQIWAALRFPDVTDMIQGTSDEKLLRMITATAAMPAIYNQVVGGNIPPEQAAQAVNQILERFAAQDGYSWSTATKAPPAPSGWRYELR